MALKASVGFTGTQNGMSDQQKIALKQFLEEYCNEFHHGDCIGADEEAHQIALMIGIPRIVIHPPIHVSKRAYCYHKYSHEHSFVVQLPPKDYLDRNHDIVNDTMGLIAAPKSDQEELRSGTWATVRYSRKQMRFLHILKR